MNGDGVIDSADQAIVNARSAQYSVGTYTSGATFTGPSTTSATFGLDRAYRGGSGLDLYYSSSWQVLEQRISGTDNAVVQFIWSPVYVNCMIERDRNADSSTANGLEERLYVLQDANWNVTALVTTDGTVLERFIYDPYGARTVLSANWVSSTDLHAFGQGFQGGFADASTGLILFQRRHYSPTLGRWLQQDPAGYVDGANLYQFVGSNPLAMVDPFGLAGAVASDPSTVVAIEIQNAGGMPPVMQQLASAVALIDGTLSLAGVDFSVTGTVNDVASEVSDWMDWQWRRARDGIFGSSTSAAQAKAKAHRDAVLYETDKGGPSTRPSRPEIRTNLNDRVTKELPAGESRTPEEVGQARNFFERNRDAARRWWEQRTGKQWPSDSTHDEHLRAIKDGGDPLDIEPGYGGPNARHSTPGPDGLTDAQRWGKMGGRPRTSK